MWSLHYFYSDLYNKDYDKADQKDNMWLLAEVSSLLV